MIKKVAIIGSTGSIGCNTLEVIKHLPTLFEVSALSAGNNVELLARQIQEFKPSYVSVENDIARKKLCSLLDNSFVGQIGIGIEGMLEVAKGSDANIVVSATVGARGLLPTLEAIKLGRRVCIANKESLVMAGEMMMMEAQKNGAEILPIDSEHNAIHQCLRGEQRDEVKKIILTASGGPFRQKSIDELSSVTVNEALNHPTWKMGRKITIDSSTLMNKGLEVVEARWLFGFSPENIEVLVHPQSVVHSMVEMIDGSVIAQLGVTDMKHPIQYALTYPERLSSKLPQLDLAKVGKLEFEIPDMQKFRCLNLAYEALQIGGTMPAVLNAANEEAVTAFLDEKIQFLSISKLIEQVMNLHKVQEAMILENILGADTWARSTIKQLISEKN